VNPSERLKALFGKRSIGGWFLLVLWFVWQRIGDLSTVEWLGTKIPSFPLVHHASLQVTLFAFGILWLTIVVFWPRLTGDGLPELPLTPATNPQTQKPRLLSLTPRICFVIDDESGTYDFVEGGREIRAAVASFRLADGPIRKRLNLIARISYATVPQHPQEIPIEIVRVNYAAWLNSLCRWVYMDVTDTNEIILALCWKDHLSTVMDNRDYPQSRRDPSVSDVRSDVKSMVAHVEIVDETHGVVLTESFRIEREPFKVMKESGKDDSLFIS
jgi:hypothetical protein